MAAGVKSAAMKRALLLLLSFALAAPAFGWSREGHELVGELAQRQLTPEAAAQVRDLLAGEADPTLAGVAAWADDIRAESRRGTHALGERSSRWHYVNFPRGVRCDYVPARDCPDGNCIFGAINAQRAILADRSRPREERRDALKFLVHFLGDVHQPMHAGFGHDRGGNEFQIQYRGKGAPAGEGTNLHSIWDYRLLRSAGLDRTAYADRLQATPVPAAQRVLAGVDNPAAAWALESCRLIHERNLYPPKHRLGDDYVDRLRPVAEERVRLAGARLADLLNTTLVAPAR